MVYFNNNIITPFWFVEIILFFIHSIRKLSPTDYSAQCKNDITIRISRFGGENLFKILIFLKIFILDDKSL